MPERETPTHTAPARATRREWIGLAVIALPCLLYSMDLTVLNLALPRLSATLHPSSAQLLWIVDIYGFVLAGLLIPMGTLGDHIGRRRLLLLGAAAFGAASVLAAFSTSASMLIAARAILGIAGATLAPSTLSLVRIMFNDDAERTTAIGLWVTSYSVGGAIGPLIGGVLLQHFWWGSVFLVGVPVMLLLLVVGPWLLPEFRDPEAGRLDFASAAQSLAAVLLVIFGVKRLAEGDAGLPAALAIAVGIAVGLIFVRRQRALADPLIDLGLFTSRAFSTALAAYALGTFMTFGVFVFVGQYLQVVLGLSPIDAGFYMVPLFCAFIIGALATPRLTRHVQPATLMIVGLLIGTGGFIALASLGTTSAPATVMVACFTYSLGLAPVFILATDLVVGTAPPERAGAASALSETGSELGGALGIAILGSIGTAVYRRAMLRGMPPGIPESGADMARATLGGAVRVAEQLPGAAGGELMRVANDAFSSSLRFAALLCAVIALATAAMLAVVMRGARGVAHTPRSP